MLRRACVTCKHYNHALNTCGVNKLHEKYDLVKGENISVCEDAYKCRENDALCGKNAIKYQKDYGLHMTIAFSSSALGVITQVFPYVNDSLVNQYVFVWSSGFCIVTLSFSLIELARQLAGQRLNKYSNK